MTGKPEFTSIRLTTETARRLRILVAEMKESDPKKIHTTDDVVARLIDRHGYREEVVLNPAKALDSSIRRWQNTLSDNVATAVLDAHARIGEHVVQATTDMRRRLLEQPKKVLADAADEVVIGTGSTLGVSVKDMRNTPCNPQTDACFYVGDRAERWEAARKDGVRQAREFATKTPPDLVVGIEVDGHDADAPARHAMQGVREMWQVTARPDARPVEIRILDLQAPDRPTVDESLLLPGVTSVRLLEAIKLAGEGRLKELKKMVQTTTPKVPKVGSIPT